MKTFLRILFLVIAGAAVLLAARLAGAAPGLQLTATATQTLPPFWTTITPVWCGGTALPTCPPTATGTWVSILPSPAPTQTPIPSGTLSPAPTLAATSTPTPLYSATPTELVYPPLLATPTPQVGEAARASRLWLPWVGR